LINRRGVESAVIVVGQYACGLGTEFDQRFVFRGVWYSAGCVLDGQFVLRGCAACGACSGASSSCRRHFVKSLYFLLQEIDSRGRSVIILRNSKLCYKERKNRQWIRGELGMPVYICDSGSVGLRGGADYFKSACLLKCFAWLGFREWNPSDLFVSQWLTCFYLGLTTVILRQLKIRGHLAHRFKFPLIDIILARCVSSIYVSDQSTLKKCSIIVINRNGWNNHT
jgi:hypothetical protein